MDKQGGGAIRVGKHGEEPRMSWKRYLTPGPPQSRAQLLAEVERQFRALLKIRSGGKVKFRFLSRESPKERRELEEEEKFWRVLDRIDEGGPEVEAILEKLRSEKERR